MATLSHEFVEQDKPRAYHEPEETARRLTLYFQSLGLPQKQAAEAADEIVANVQARLDDPAENVTSTAVNGALEVVGHWLDEIVATCPNPSRELRLQLAWFLRPVLKHHPEIFLRHDGLHEDLRQAVQALSKPILPPSAPAEMPPQLLGELPRAWYRLLAYGNLIWDWATEGLREQR